MMLRADNPAKFCQFLAIVSRCMKKFIDFLLRLVYYQNLEGGQARKHKLKISMQMLRILASRR